MKKPKVRNKFADRYDVEHLVCSLRTKVVVIKKGDFDLLWKLAKEALHYEESSRTGV